MKRLGWEMRFGSCLIVLSVVMYVIHYTIFREASYIFRLGVAGMAFLPISVLFITLVINRVLTRREKRLKLEKLNMLIGLFFSEVGTTLLMHFSDWDRQLVGIQNALRVTNDWSEQQFLSVRKLLQNCDYCVEIKRADLALLRDLLMEKRDFLMRLIENPNMLEHESFTGLLRAVFHLSEELASRQDVRHLPDADREHLAGDIKRAYVQLVHEWLDYMKHLKNSYPYLFSLAMRMNPFDEEASPTVP